MALINENQQAVYNRLLSKYEGFTLCEIVSMNTQINT